MLVYREFIHKSCSDDKISFILKTTKMCVDEKVVFLRAVTRWSRMEQDGARWKGKKK